MDILFECLVLLGIGLMHIYLRAIVEILKQIRNKL